MGDHIGYMIIYPNKWRSCFRFGIEAFNGRSMFLETVHDFVHVESGTVDACDYLVSGITSLVEESAREDLHLDNPLSIIKNLLIDSKSQLSQQNKITHGWSSGQRQRAVNPSD